MHDEAWLTMAEEELLLEIGSIAAHLIKKDVGRLCHDRWRKLPRSSPAEEPRSGT